MGRQKTLWLHSYTYDGSTEGFVESVKLFVEENLSCIIGYCVIVEFVQIQQRQHAGLWQ